MTLKEWCDEAGVKPTHPTTETGAVSVVVDANDLVYSGKFSLWLYYQLWRLDDYAVSSSGRPVVWLVPRRPETTPAAAVGATGGPT